MGFSVQSAGGSSNGLLDYRNYHEQSMGFDDGSTAIAPLASTLSGTGSSVSKNTSNVDKTHNGVTLASTGTTTTGYAIMRLGSTFEFGENQIFFAESLMRDLSTVGEEFIIRIGWTNNTTAAAPTYGIWFEYDRLTNVNWLRCTNDTTGVSAVDTGVAAAEDAFSAFEWIISSTGSEAEFFINGTSVGTNSTKVPASTTLVTPQVHIVKSAGTTARVVETSSMYLRLPRS